MKKLVLACVICALGGLSVSAAGFWNAVGNILNAAAQSTENTKSAVKGDFDEQLKEIESIFTQASKLADGARTRLESLKTAYAALTTTYGALFPPSVTNDASVAANETLKKLNAKLTEGEATVTRLSAKASDFARSSSESATLEPSDENLVQLQQLAQAMLNDFNTLKAEDRSLANLINIALIQITAAKQQAE